MSETSYLLLRTTAAKMCWELEQRIENEWMTGDERHKVEAKLTRLSRFKEYVKLHEEFNP
jgi:hypothetical protein